MLNQKHKDFLSWHIYQIYPRSFMDANGDGIGDLQGVIQKLDYLKDLGINAIWMCPCYKSPNVDNGYDVADYRDIMDEFGTIEDIKALIAEMHKRDMKLVMDLVPNHTSDQHVWFRESRKSRDNPYADFYYWYDTPPNNWGSMFGGSAYSFDPVRGQYYLHSYAPQQPDLNWENPQVVKAMQDVIDFWVDMGVDGFRIDVIDQISKDFEGDRNCFGPRLHEFIHAMFGREKTKHLFTVGECWAGELDEIRRHVGQDRDELSTLFMFGHLDCGRKDKFTPKADDLRHLWRIQSAWTKIMQDNDLLFSLFTDNHDNNYLMARLGDQGALRYESACCIAAMTYLLRGVSFIYQGQELGMIGSHHDSIQEFDDVESYNFYEEFCQTMPAAEALEKINFGSRDNTRHPMCWDGSETGGFTTGKPWMALHSAHKQINLATDQVSEKSVWRFYRDLLHLRAVTPALTVGEFQDITPENANYCAFTRKEGEQRVLVVCNFREESTIAVPEARGQVLLSNYGIKEKTDTHYRPYEVAVFMM